MVVDHSQRIGNLAAIGVGCLFVWVVCFKLLDILPPLEKYKPKCERPLKEHRQVRIYLMFLEVNRNLFIFLTVISMFIVVPIWGWQYYMIFIPVPGIFETTLTKDMGEAGPVCICSLSLAIGMVSFLYTAKFHQFSSRETKQRGSKEHRSVWLSNVPVRDEATLQPHQMTLQDLEVIVATDLKKALEDKVIQNEVKTDVAGGSGACPLGELPCNAGCCRCALACTLGWTCCQCMPVKQTAYHHDETYSSSRHMRLETDETDSSEARMMRRRYDSGSTCGIVKEIFVQPVMTPYVGYITLYQRIKDAKERREAYRLMADRQKNTTPPEWRNPYACDWLRRYYKYKHRSWNKTYSQLYKELMSKEVGLPVQMSGHAFVVFDQYEDVLVMLGPRRQWHEIRDYTPFRFGRPPFTSVTLQCRRAPHPRDLRWDNLHVNMCPRVLFHAMNLVALFSITVVIVAAASLASNVSGLDDCFDPGSSLSTRVQRMCSAFRYVNTGFRFAPDVLPQIALSYYQQLPTLVLMTFNSCGVPCIIWLIAELRAYTLYSYGQILELDLNIVLLLLSKFIVPIISIFTFSFVGAWANAGTDYPNWQIFESVFSKDNDVIGNSGRFYLRYAINCAFISNVFTLLQIARRQFRFILLQFYALTESEVRLANKPTVFAWGYWYAWSLTLATNGLVMGIVVPSMLPITALNFALKHYVDSRLFEGRAFNPGPELRSDQTGSYSPRVAHYMFQNIALMFFCVGAGLLFYVFLHFERFSRFSATSASLCGVLGIVLGVLLQLSSQVMKVQTLLDESFGKQPDTLLTSVSGRLLRCIAWLMLEPENDTRPSDDMTTRLVEEDISWDARRNMLEEALAGETNEELKSKMKSVFGLKDDFSCVWRRLHSRSDIDETPSSLEDLTKRQTSESLDGMQARRHSRERRDTIIASISPATRPRLPGSIDSMGSHESYSQVGPQMPFVSTGAQSSVTGESAESMLEQGLLDAPRQIRSLDSNALASVAEQSDQMSSASSSNALFADVDDMDSARNSFIESEPERSVSTPPALQEAVLPARQDSDASSAAPDDREFLRVMEEDAVLTVGQPSPETVIRDALHAEHEVETQEGSLLDLVTFGLFGSATPPTPPPPIALFRSATPPTPPVHVPHDVEPESEQPPEGTVDVGGESLEGCTSRFNEDPPSLTEDGSTQEEPGDQLAEEKADTNDVAATAPVPEAESPGLDDFWSRAGRLESSPTSEDPKQCAPEGKLI